MRQKFQLTVMDNCQFSVMMMEHYKALYSSVYEGYKKFSNFSDFIKLFLLKEIFPRGNNKVIIYFLIIMIKGLLFMLELY